MTMANRQPLPRKTALNSDTLTGQYLEPGRATYVVRTPDSDVPVVKPVRYVKARKTALEATGDVIVAPIKLHRNETDAGGLGGLVYTVMMLQYLRYATDAKSRAEQLELIAWWKSDYGRRRVLRGLERKLDVKAARHALEVVLAFHQAQTDPAAIAARFHHSELWVRNKVDWCMKIASGHRVNCQCETCAQRDVT